MCTTDLSKAYDCIKYNTLKDKSYECGAHGIQHTLIKSYLTNRTQHMKVKHVAYNQLKKIM